jgi:hypothetical protein
MDAVTGIPTLAALTCTAAAHWFEEMAEAGLICHPEDDLA